jgi:hypothetical protein
MMVPAGPSEDTAKVPIFRVVKKKESVNQRGLAEVIGKL